MNTNINYSRRFQIGHFGTAAALSLFLLTQSQFAAIASGASDENALRAAWSLYNQKNYAASADAFEHLIATSTPNPRLYYYAAAANNGCNRLARARQLCDYITTKFPTSPEADYARKLVLLSVDAPKATANVADSLPASLKGKSLDELMQTEEGRKALRDALHHPGGNSSPAVAAAAPSVVHAGASKDSSQAISVDDIAKDGANGVSQFISRPNLCLETSMAAVAGVPRGQQLIASMIRTAGGPGVYAVRFPHDGTEYTITAEKMEQFGIKDKALWATLLHCALLLRLHNNYHGTIEDGLTLLTGKNPEKVFAANTTVQSLADFIGDALKNQCAIVCESQEDLESLTPLVEAERDYVIVGFEPATGMVTLKDPHGENSRRFRLKTDPEHKLFEQLNDGVSKMNLSLFPKYFKEVVRAPI